MGQHSGSPVRLPLPYDGPLDPPADWKRLREQCPVATAELPSGDTGALLTRYDHVKALLSDTRFSRPTAEDSGARIAPEGGGGASTNGDMSLSIPHKGEGHLRWRRLLAQEAVAGDPGVQDAEPAVRRQLPQPFGEPVGPPDG